MIMMTVMLITMTRMALMLITVMRVAVNPRSTYPHFPSPWAAEPHAPILLRQPDIIIIITRPKPAYGAQLRSGK